MKKLLSLLLAIAMLLGVAAAEDITGAWYADFFGMPVEFLVYDDATYSMDMMGDVMTGVWALQGNELVLDAETENEMIGYFDESYPSITLDVAGLELLFTREAPASYTPAAPVADATLDDMQGAWVTEWFYMYGMMLDPYTAGNELYVLVDDINVTLTVDDGYSAPSIVTGTCTFADGALTFVEPATEYSDETTYVLRLLEDGMLACEAEMYGDQIGFYMSATDIDLIPQPAGPVDTELLLGTWYEESYTLTINEDGTAVLLDYLGYTENYNWIATDEGGMFTDGFFANSTFTLEWDGSLNVAGWLSMTRDPYVAPEPYDITLILGEWVEEDGSEFIVNDDYTAVYHGADGTEMVMDWENGEYPLITTGNWWLGTITLNEEGVLIVDDGFTHKEFTSKYVIEEPVEPVEPAAPTTAGEAISIDDPSTYIEKLFVCVSIVQNDTPCNMDYMPESSIIFHENGLADVTILSVASNDQAYSAGTAEGSDALMTTYTDYLPLTYTISETGLDLIYMGTINMHFEVQ